MSVHPAVPKLARGLSLSQYISNASDIELQQARDLFDLIDRDGKGRISSGEEAKEMEKKKKKSIVGSERSGALRGRGLTRRGGQCR